MNPKKSTETKATSGASLPLSSRNSFGAAQAADVPPRAKSAGAFPVPFRIRRIYNPK
jgi:hypothetical protein